MPSRVTPARARGRIAAFAALLAAAVLGGCTQETGVAPAPATPVLPVEDSGQSY